MAARTKIFWCKVFFQEFIRHFRKLSDEEIVRDVRQSMDDLEELADDTDTFGSQMIRWALQRADEPFATAARENGKKGGRPRKNKEITEDAPAREDGDGLTTPGNGALRNSLPSSGNSQDASTDKASTDASCNTATAKPIAATKTGGFALDMPEPDKDKQAQAPDYGGNRRQATATTTPLHKVSTDDPKKAESRKGRTRASNYSLSESVVDTDARVQSCEVLNLAYSGRNGLVVLSQEEYNRLLQETGNKKKADRLVDSLDYALAEGKEFNQKHINVLLHWKDYRDEKLIAAKYGKNFADRQDQMVRDNMQLADDIRNGRIAL